MKTEWPNLFVIGAPKAGTTTLHDMLVTSSEVHAPSVKESCYFASRHQWERGHVYAQRRFRFATDAPLSLESTPWNFYVEPALRRMAEVTDLDSAVAIVILRDPIDRAVSMYFDQYGQGLEKRPLDAALAADLESDWGWQPTDLDTELRQAYLRCGLYEPHVRRIVRYFPSTVFLSFDELRSAPGGIAARLQVALGLSDLKVVSAANRRSMQRIPVTRAVRTVGACIPSPARAILSASPMMDPLQRALRRSVSMVEVSTSPSQRPTIATELLSEARRRLAPQISKLEQLTGQPFSWNWS